MKPDFRIERFIMAKEDFRAAAYKPTPNDVWTIGYGSTKGVRPGDTITVALATERFLKELEEDYRKPLVKLLQDHKISLNKHQFDAVLSLVYNIGIPAFAKSKAFVYLKTGNLVRFLFEAFDKEYGFVRQGKTILGGLVVRRREEANIFIQGHP